MNNHFSTIVQRLWNYCNVLRDDKIEKELDGALPCGDDVVPCGEVARGIRRE